MGSADALDTREFPSTSRQTAASQDDSPISSPSPTDHQSSSVPPKPTEPISFERRPPQPPLTGTSFESSQRLVESARAFGTPRSASPSTPSSLRNTKLSRLRLNRNRSLLDFLSAAAAGSSSNERTGAEESEGTPDSSHFEWLRTSPTAQNPRLTDEEVKHNIRKLRLDVQEVRGLIDTYRRADPYDQGLNAEEFKHVAGGFLASKASGDPSLIFKLFDVGESGTVTLREFVCGFAVLCRGSKEERIRYLFNMVSKPQEGYLNREQLTQSLRLLYKYAASADMDPDMHDAEANVHDVVDSLLRQVPGSDQHGLSFNDFFDVIMSDETAMGWMDKLSQVAGEHLRNVMSSKGRVQVELDLTRSGILDLESETASSPKPSGAHARRFAYGDSQSETSETAPDADSRSGSPSGASADKGPNSSETSRSSIGGPPPRVKIRRSRAHCGRSRKSSSVLDEIRGSDANYPFIIDYDGITLEKIIGRGACATVWSGAWLHMPVAVKVFEDRESSEESSGQLILGSTEFRNGQTSQFASEIELLTQIRHPNVLLYMGICVEPRLCIVTELFTGGSVHEYLHGPNPRRFHPELALEMISNVARGMFYLHSSDPMILHGDLKASNILVDRNINHCVICDFGLSRLASNQSTRKLISVGTPYTMAPEVMERKEYTQASDIYSFGIVAWEIYTGRVPFKGLRPVQLMFMVTEGKRPDFKEEDNVPPELQELIERCWANDPDKRPNFDIINNVLESAPLKQQVRSAQEVWDSIHYSAGGSRSTESSHSDFYGQKLPLFSLSKDLIDVSAKGNVNAVSTLLEKGADVAYCDYDKRTALHVAAAEGRIDCIKLLLKAGADANARDRWGNTPLQDALVHERQYGSSEGTQALLNWNTQISKMKHKLQNGHSFPTGDQSELVYQESAAAEAKKDVSRRRDSIALSIAIHEDDEETVTQLLRRGIDVNVGDYDGRTPLTVASSEGRLGIVKRLLENGADIYARDRWGSTALHEARRAGHTQISLLLEVAFAKRQQRHLPSPSDDE